MTTPITRKELADISFRQMNEDEKYVFISTIEYQHEQNGIEYEKLNQDDSTVAWIIEGFIRDLDEFGRGVATKNAQTEMRNRLVYRGSSYTQLNEIKKHYVKTGTILKGRMKLNLK